MGFLKAPLQQFNSQFQNPMDRIGFGLNQIAQGGGAEAGYELPPGFGQQQMQGQVPVQPFRNVFQMIGHSPFMQQVFGRRG